MTLYVLSSPVGNQFIGIKAVTYEIRILRMEFLNDYTNKFTVRTLTRKANSTISGGTVATPAPLRDGSTAATAQCRIGTVSSTGTETSVGWLAIPGDPDNTGRVHSSFEIPFEWTIAPGDAFWFDTGTSGSGPLMDVLVYFEELHLAWRY
jgi:hypothetical protein